MDDKLKEFIQYVKVQFDCDIILKENRETPDSFESLFGEYINCSDNNDSFIFKDEVVEEKFIIDDLDICSIDFAA